MSCKTRPDLYLIILTVTLHLSNISVKGQSYFFDVYAASEDAPSQINFLIQDSDYYLWLGTKEGVTRFDGISFESFTTENGMAPQAVRTIYQDSEGRIWFGHEGGGISTYRDGMFSVFHRLDSLVNDNISAIFQDHKKQIWITTVGSGAFLLKEAKDGSYSEVKHFIGKDKLSDRVYNYCLSHDSSVYLIADVGVRKYIEAENTFEVHHPKGLTRYFNVICMFEDRQQNQWFGTYNGGLYKYSPVKDTVFIYDKRDGLSSNWIWVIEEDQLGNIWVGTEGGGVTRINQLGLKVFNDKNGLPAKDVYDIILDSEGNICIGSSNSGLAIFKGGMFDNIGEADGLLNTKVNAIVQDNSGNYWIGTNNGIDYLDERFFAQEKVKVDELLLPLTEVHFLKKDQQGKIWIGTMDKRVLLLNPETKEIDLLPVVDQWFGGFDNNVLAMELDDLNRLSVGTEDGLIVYDIDSAKTIRYSTGNGLPGNSITALYADKQNTIWVGARNVPGISAIDANNQIKTILLDKVYNPSCFVKDPKGRLWIGTSSHGVLILSNDSVEQIIDIDKGLLSNTIHTLNVDKYQHILIGTNSGLNIFDLEDERIHTYGKKNGYTGIETNQFASYVDRKDNVWFGTNMGLTRLRPSDFKPNVQEPNLRIKSLRVNLIDKAIEEEIRLAHSQNHVQIAYQSISTTNPEAVRYKTWLVGQDTAWQEITASREITFPALQPGKYVFKVIARNSSGVWNESPVELAFKIMQPFYFRWYFVLSFVLVVLALFRVYVMLRERKLVKEKKVLAQKVEERTVELKETNDKLIARNKDITDSIKYALRIQMSILPPQIPFKDVFVLFKPKDIVSGDFYWMETVGDKEIIAAVDCTGHGVPGAFMSFVGYSSLNEVVKEKGITRPSEILARLNQEVIRALNLHDVNAIEDGMDMAIVSFDKKTYELEYSGAYNPLYIIDGELQEIKADRFAIGKTIGYEKRFKNHKVKVTKGSTMYIFSDGYADQFGGEKYKKFKPGAVKRMLLEIQDKSMEQQKEILETTIEEWRGGTEQIDDILFIGRRF